MRRILWLLLALSLPAWATINAITSTRILLPSYDGTRYGQYPSGDYDPSPPVRVFRYQGNFDTVFGGNGAMLNGGFVQTLTTAGADACTGNATTLGGLTTGYKPDSVYMVRREDSETILGSTITPRTGSGFLYQLLDPALNYGSTCINGTSTADKPRTSLALTQSAYKTILPYDKEIFIGFSIFVPADIEAENCGTNNLDYRNTLISMAINTHGYASTANWNLNFATKTDGDTDPQFFVDFYIDESTQYNGSSTEYRVWLGDVANDRGQWVDFVIRVRVNPHAADSAGIFQIWRTDPADRSGDLKMVYNLATDTAYPIGGSTTPNAAGVTAALRDQFGMDYDPSKTGMEIDFRAYKYAWGTGRGCPPYPGGSTVTNGHYAFGWDDIYIAWESDGSDCTDVTPERAACAAAP